MSCAVAARNRDDGDCGRTVRTKIERAQDGLWVIVLGGCKGEVAGGSGEVVGGGKGVWLGDGALEELLGFGVALEVDEGVGVVVEEGGVGGGLGGEAGEERLGLVVLAGLAEEAGIEAGDGGV